MIDLERGAIDHGAVHRLARRAFVATSRCECLFARSLDKPHASSLRASWRRSHRIDLRCHCNEGCDLRAVLLREPTRRFHRGPVAHLPGVCRSPGLDRRSGVRGPCDLRRDGAALRIPGADARRAESPLRHRAATTSRSDETKLKLGPQGSRGEAPEPGALRGVLRRIHSRDDPASDAAPRQLLSSRARDRAHRAPAPKS
jgi:hypothetical protein